MSTTLDVLILAVLQGIAEFLPVSSSGHLVIGQKLLGLEQQGVRLEIALHAGTLLAVMFFYRGIIAKTLAGLFRRERESWNLAINLVIAAVPAAVAYLLFKKPLDDAQESIRVVGYSLLFTGAVLTLLRFAPKREGAVTPFRALMIGLAQAVALLPGVSRSGMTIAAARYQGVAPATAAEFSFLVSIPLIGGATALQALKSGGPSVAGAVPAWELFVGAVVAGVIGYFALVWLVRLLNSGFFWCFGPYCLLAGAATLIYLV